MDAAVNEKALGSTPDLDVDLREYARPPLRELRGLIRAALRGEDADCVADAELVVTELVSNAFDHGDAPRRLHMWRTGHPVTVHIAVGDSSRTDLPVVGKSRLGSARGRGLIMVSRLSRRWGVSLHRLGKTVWAELTCPAPLAHT